MPTFSFQNPPGDIAFAKPKAVRLGAASYATESWAKVLETVARAVLRDAHYRKKARPALAELGATGKKRLLRRPMELEDGLWLEGNRAAADIVGRVRRLLAGCGYPLEAAVLEYEPAPRKSPIPLKGRPPRNDPAKAFHPRKGEKAGAFARRMFSKMLADGRVPRDDFFACLDDKDGTKMVLGLLPGGHPLFSRCPMKDGQNLRSWTEACPTRFGFPVYVNSQWKIQHLDKLVSLLEKWGKHHEPCVSFPSTPVQTTLFGPPAPQQMVLFPASRQKEPASPARPSEKIGTYAKHELYEALAKGRIPDGDFSMLLTLKGTKQLLGLTLTTCPLFSYAPMVRRDGRRGSWNNPAVRNGTSIYVNSQWYEEYRPKLDKLLARWAKKDNLVTYDEWIPLVLEVMFPNGFQPGNFIDTQRFKTAWQRELNVPWPYQSDAAFDRAVRAVSVSVEGRLFAPASLLPEDIAKKLARDILSRFAKGARSVRFPPLFNEWKNRLEGSRVYDPAALRAVAKWLLRDRKELVFKGLAVTNDPDWFDNPIPEVERVLDEHGTLMSVDELCRELPDFSEDDLIHACRDSSSIILAKPRHYIAVSAVSFDTTANRTARDWLDREFRRAVHVPVRALAEAVRSDSPSFADTTDGFTTDAYSAFFRSAIGDAFDVTSFVVARKGEGADIRDVAKSWLAGKDAFDLDDFLALVESFGAMAALYPQMAGFFADFIRIDATHFVRKDGLRFSVADIDRVLVGATADGVLPIFDENVRHLLPPAPNHLAWTPWLLADYADKVSTGFRFLSGSTSQREALGAIVPAASPFRHYEDILPGILARALTVNLADARGAILWLYENGWIPQRRFRDIDRVLGVARTLRAQKKRSL